MQLVLTLSAVVFLSFGVFLSQATPFRTPDRSAPRKPVQTGYIEPILPGGVSITDNGKGDGTDGEFSEDVDFEDEDSESISLVGLAGQGVNSVTHLHEKKGEILVPCFGMWWPVGTVYDYGVDYYGDYRKKRRRSRKQKKAARTQKKKA